MRLTNIKLSGFKSFVDPSTLPVSGQLVAVIGPNGCGKSNVIDAIRWVLGEASAKQLRGQSMQDVIFNGSTTRKAVSRAVVELVFDNTNHSIQNAWGQYNEISIKRTLTRQGESNYFINNQIVRRKDITDLFLGTGVGTKGYAIIEQGMISRIIEARPEELRAYLEEAAGVSKYKERRRETEQRLQDTQTNLSRLADLQSELDRQIEKLEKQAKVAAQYQELTHNLNHQQNLLAFIRFQDAKSAQEQASLKITQHQTELAQMELLSTQLNEEGYQRQLEEHDVQQNQHQVQNQWALTREQRARLEEQIRYQQNLNQRLNDEKLKTEKALEALKQEEKDQTAQLTLHKNQLEEQQYILSENQLQLETVQETLPIQEENLQELEGAYLSQNSEQNQLQREYELSVQKEKQYTEQLNNTIERSRKLENEINELNIPSHEAISLAEEALSLEQSKQEILEEKIDLHEQTLNQLQITQQEKQQQYQKLNTEKTEWQAQKNALMQLVTHESENHNQFWENQNLAETPVLWQHIQVAPKWQKALEVFLSERFYARSTPVDLNTAQPDEKTVWINPENIDNNRDTHSDSLFSQIQADAPFNTALNLWLANIICADDVSTAISERDTLKDNQTFITPEGHLIDKFSVYWQGQSSKKSQLTWLDDIKLSEEKLLELEPLLTEKVLEQKTLEQQISEKKQQLSEIKEQQKAYNQKLQAAHQHHTQLLTGQSQTQLRFQHIEQERTTLDEQKSRLTQQIEAEKQFAEEREIALKTLTQDFQNIQVTRTKAQQTLQALRAQMYEASRRLGLEQIKEQKLIQQISYTEVQIKEIKQKQSDLNEKQTELNLEFNDNEQEKKPLAALEALIETQNTLEETLNTIQDQLRTLQENHKNIQHKQNTLISEQQQKQQTLHNCELEQQQAQLLAERLQEDLTKNNAKIAKLQEALHSPPDLNELAKSVSQLAQNIERLGAVNLIALEELEQSKQRQLYFNTQYDDLQQAISSLNTAIEQIDNESKALFEQTFNAVNEKIRQYFPTLFGGGNAHLEMVGDDLLTSGIAIMAHPPGKKNSSIHLLSGGEKALTAMSLVFALFSLNPAPFCLLDEVDAPLDDANTSRFCQLVKEMSRNTQFLFISHNRLTMEMADQLVGVTMQEKGVSRIVSVDIQEALAIGESI